MRSKAKRTKASRKALFALVTMLIGTSTAALARETLSGEEIRDLVTTSRIYLSTPLGGEMPMNYRAGGRVDASGEAVGLGRFFQPKDEGRWWISGDNLCQQWQSWYKGERICFRLQRTGGTNLIWRRDNGEQGKARFAPR